MVTWLSFRGQMRCFIIQGVCKIELLLFHIKNSHLRGFGDLTKTLPGCLPTWGGMVKSNWAETPRADPELAGLVL